ncbi:uncharacterized protein LOC130677863 isoform X2 [Microplitis mediator]|uniref:uncharacterized protein LOC130677863 isoform X2 n=1 Tax=Microplitis mediator TaxID=375433 RepID=UPI002553C0A3|nr:uncharacterized protein LOC130677863 isoform X2 [Microplitis mediator]
MKRSEKPTDDEDETEIDEEVTESEESGVSNKKPHFLGIPIYKLSYKRLPRKCLRISFFTINAGVFLAGISAVVISMWMLADSKLMLRLTAQKLFVTILLIIGIVFTILAFIGIVAFAKKKKKFLIILKCCGIKSYKDWGEYLMEIPQSCCSKLIDQCLQMSPDVAYKSGCLKNSYLMLKSYVDTVTVAILLLSFTTGVSLFLAVGLKKKLKSRMDY